MDACIGAGPGENNRKAKKTLGNGESKGDRQIKQLAARVISENWYCGWASLAPRRCMQKWQMMQTQRCDLFFLYARIVFIYIYTVMDNTIYMAIYSYIFFSFSPFLEIRPILFTLFIRLDMAGCWC